MLRIARWVLVGSALAAACVQSTSSPSPSSVPPPPASAADATAPPPTDASLPDAGGPGGELPPVAPLTPDDLKRTWVRIAAPHANNPALVTRAPDGFVALANETTPTGGKDIGPSWNHVYRSTDGVTWQRMPSLEQPFGLSYGPIVYGAGRYVAFYAGNFNGQVYTSTDLAQWSPGPFAPDGDGGGVPDFFSVHRLEHRFFGLGLNNLWTSSDGLTWSPTFVSIVQGRAIAYGNGAFVVAGSLSIRRSTDGTSWEDRTPSCDTPGAACVSLPGDGGTTIGGPYGSAVFLDGKFYVDHLTSTDGITWTGHDAPIAHATLGGWLFNLTDGIRAWRPGQAVQTITVEATPTPASLASGNGPATVSTALAGGETCLDHRCVVLDALYLLR